MNELRTAGIPSRNLSFPSGFEVSWMGPNPYGEGFCLGSETGLLQFFNRDFVPISEPHKFSSSGEAINSVARLGNWVAASTRSEITLVSNAETIDVPYGAHQVCVTPSGYLAAALGPLGLAFINPDKQYSRGLKSQSEKSYIYRLIALRGRTGCDRIVCAGRLSGVTQGDWHPSQQSMKMETMSIPDLDIVDICSMGSQEHPYGTAALARNGAIILSQDITQDRNPRKLQFANVTGTGYRIVACGGHIFVLTNTGLFGVWNLTKLNGDASQNEPVEYSLLGLPMQAVDINVVNDRHLLVVKLDAIECIDVHAISEPGEKQAAQISQPLWDHQTTVNSAKDHFTAA
jgi:hypothetical protein